MKRKNDSTDPTELDRMLTELRLPDVRAGWRSIADQSDRDGWPAAKFLSAVAENELAGREQRRIARRKSESRLATGKTIDAFDFKVTADKVSKAQITALAAGGDWIDSGANLVFFGPPGVGKSHLAAAIGHSLVDRGYRVLGMGTTELTQKLQAEKEANRLAGAIARLDKYHLLILDDFTYARRDSAEGSVLFDLIGHRYESRSLLITSNQAFASWSDVFGSEAMAVAAVDRIVHHSTIVEMQMESYRRREAVGNEVTGPKSGREA